MHVHVQTSLSCIEKVFSCKTKAATEQHQTPDEEKHLEMNLKTVWHCQSTKEGAPLQL